MISFAKLSIFSHTRKYKYIFFNNIVLLVLPLPPRDRPHLRGTQRVLLTLPKPPVRMGRLFHSEATVC